VLQALCCLVSTARRGTQSFSLGNDEFVSLVRCSDLEGNGPLPSRVYFNAEVDTRSFWEHYMPVFHDCIVTAKGMHAMCSYNSMNGVPTCGDPNLLNGVLREQWGWDGFVVSD